MYSCPSLAYEFNPFTAPFRRAAADDKGAALRFFCDGTSFDARCHTRMISVL